jgi:hypothetical protein
MWLKASNSDAELLHFCCNTYIVIYSILCVYDFSVMQVRISTELSLSDNTKSLKNLSYALQIDLWKILEDLR